MKSITLFIITLFLSILSYAQKIEKELKVEKDGFKWYKITVMTESGDVTWGSQDINGNYIITPEEMLPFYSPSAGGYFWTMSRNHRKIYTKEGRLVADYDESIEEVNYHKADDGNIWIEIHKDGKGGAKDLDGNWLIEMSTQNNEYLNYYAGKWVAQNKGGYFDIRQGFSPRDSRKKTNSSSKTTSNSSQGNNNKFWYTKYYLIKMDSHGNAILSTKKEIKSNGGNTFEIQFIYDKASSVPVRVKFNELDKNDKLIKTENLGGIIDKNSVIYEDDGVTLVTMNYAVKVTTDGHIIIREINKDSTFTNCSLKFFQANEIASQVYQIRYEVLVENLEKLLK